jgi:hypothetical protein
MLQGRIVKRRNGKDQEECKVIKMGVSKDNKLEEELRFMATIPGFLGSLR